MKHFIAAFLLVILAVAAFEYASSDDNLSTVETVKQVQADRYTALANL